MVSRDELTAMVRALQKGEDGAAAAIYETFQSDIYYYIYKTVNDAHLAEDLTQDTFMEILETIGKLQEPAAFVTWSRQIAYHRCTAHFRKRRELLADEDADGYTVFDTVQEDRTEFIPDEALDKAELRQTIQNMVNGLPPEQRAAIMMRYFDELSVKQIADIQGVSEGTVKSRLNYGRKCIQKSVEDYEKKNGIKLRCAGVVPLLLWLFRETRIAGGISLTAQTAAATAAAGTTAAAAAGTTAAAAAGTTAAATAGTAVATKVVAGVTAAALLAGGAAVAFFSKPEEPEKTKPAFTAPTEPEKLWVWTGYGEDSAGINTKRFEMTVEEMTDERIRGHMQVTLLYNPTHDSDFEGTGTVREDGCIEYAITFDSPAVMGTIPTFEYYDMVLIYDPETEKCSIDQWYYVEMDRAVPNPPPETVLEKNEVWSGTGECTFCWPGNTLHEMRLWVERMTEKTISGTFTVYYDPENVEYHSTFTGRSFGDENFIYYEIDMETSKIMDVIGGELVFDTFFLTYDRNNDTMSISFFEAYEGTFYRDGIAPEN